MCKASAPKMPDPIKPPPPPDLPDETGQMAPGLSLLASRKKRSVPSYLRQNVSGLSLTQPTASSTGLNIPR